MSRQKYVTRSNDKAIKQWKITAQMYLYNQLDNFFKLPYD